MTALDDVAARAVTLFVAPVGAGKTTSVAAWCCSSAPMPVTWVRSGADLTREKLAETLRQAADKSRPRTSDALKALRPARARHIVVVDDAHLLPSSTVWLIDEVVSTCPDAVRLVLLCDWAPPLAAAARDSRHLRALGGDALRLCEDEARQLVTLHAPDLADEVVETLVGQAWGWAELVVLAATALAGSPDPRATARRLTDHGTAVADLLSDRVFPALGDRTRHLLLCLANEPTVTATAAAALTGDDGAGELLAELADVGLVVRREPCGESTAGGAAAARPAGPRARVQNGERATGALESATFRVHPWLADVSQRRIHLGGVAVTRALATVRKSALSRLADGDVPEAFCRLVRAKAWSDAVGVLADRGDELIMKVPSDALRAVTVAAPELLQSAPGAWVTVALDRWVSSDHDGATQWIRQVLADGGGWLSPQVELALLELISARIGKEGPATWAAQPSDAVEDEQLEAGVLALSAWLLLELGIAKTWMDDPKDADRHLNWAASVAEPVSRQLLAAALAQLAQTDRLLGHHHNAELLISRILAKIPDTGAINAVTARAHVLRDLVRSAQDDRVPLEDDPGGTRAPRDSSPGERRQPAPESKVDTPGLDHVDGMPSAWRQVRARLALEQCMFAVLKSDVATLSTLREELVAVGAAAEVALVDAALADLANDLQRAKSVLALAGQMRKLFPHSYFAVSVFRAQMLDSLGRSDEALAVLKELAEGVGERGGQPFPGPSTPGTSTPGLLGRLRERYLGPWAKELKHISAPPRPGRPRSSSHGTAYRRKSMDQVWPQLTPREYDVLAELARGSTYADIAETLFVTENTVKTHVSALYAKLGAARRSEALKAARTLGIV